MQNLNYQLVLRKDDYELLISYVNAGWTKTSSDRKNATTMQQYSNLIEAIDGLKRQGYTEDFNLQQHCIECRDRQFRIFHDEFVVDKYFRFDVSSDAADQSIIYAISSEKYGIKGILINGYGIYTETVTNEMLHKLTIV